MIHSKMGYGSEAMGSLRAASETSTKVPGLPAKTTYLKDLRILKGNMSLSKDGYDTPAVARSISVLRKKYPLAYAVFQEELRGLG